jgi:4-hydroxybenzoate polyprenyltransferase
MDGVTVSRSPKLADYLKLARFDHATKHVFILPGILLALVLRGAQNSNLAYHIALGLICAVTIASANYVINEWLDRDFDRHHPTKSARVSVNVALNPALVYALWLAFLFTGLFAAFLSSWLMLAVALVFGLQGIVYNVPPLRSKDRAFLDVISESINNPLRLLIGWAMIDAWSLPPSSIVLAYWLGGAFLMAAKRFSEYREIVSSHGLELLVRYRKSFGGYTETSLFTSTFLYALLSVGLFSVFLTKYRIEYILSLPFLCILFAVYMALSMGKGSVAQAPEKLFSSRLLMVATFAFAASVLVLTFVDLPVVEYLSAQRYISLVRDAV